MFDNALQQELAAIAKDIGIETAALLAIIEVESGGRLGASVNGKLEPLIRFEGHYFYRLLPRAKRAIAIAGGLASPKAGAVRNPLRQGARWKLLRRAEAIDRPAALASCSWGLGQVMGAHWRWLGYASIDCLVTEARDGVTGQVRLMMRYIKKAKLVEKLQALDWAGFARAYNGPGFRRNRYHLKMEAAYYRHMGLGPNLVRQQNRASRHAMPLLKIGSYGTQVLDLQKHLNMHGYALRLDGDFGPATQSALKIFQRAHRLSADGIFGPKTFEVLMRKLPIGA